MEKPTVKPEAPASEDPPTCNICGLPLCDCGVCHECHHAERLRALTLTVGGIRVR